MILCISFDLPFVQHIAGVLKNPILQVVPPTSTPNPYFFIFHTSLLCSLFVKQTFAIRFHYLLMIFLSIAHLWLLSQCRISIFEMIFLYFSELAKRTFAIRFRYLLMTYLFPISYGVV